MYYIQKIASLCLIKYLDFGQCFFKFQPSALNDHKSKIKYIYETKQSIRVINKAYSKLHQRCWFNMYRYNNYLHLIQVYRRKINYNKFFESRMGHVLSTTNQSNEDQGSQLKLNVEPEKPVKEDLKPLLNWSLLQIREIYAPFRRRKGSPILTRSQFLRFIQLSRISSFHIYDSITKTDQINIFEILSILTMGAYTSYAYKLQFLFNIFDLRCRKKLSFTELILMYKSIIRGFCFLTGQALPDNQLLDKFGLAMFSKADLNNDQLLEIGQIVGWLETTTQNLVLFKLFDPPMFGKEEYHIFNSFVQYSSQEINIMLNRVHKLYTKQKIQDEDYLVLKPILKVRTNNQSGTIMKMSMSQTWGKKFRKQETSHDKENIKSKSPDAFLTKNAKNTSNLMSLMKSENSSFLPSISTNTSKYHTKKKFENIIIIKGRSITKKQVFELRQYFDSMSVGKRHILIQDFIENFSQEKYNHMKSVAASLFNFLDKKQNGMIEFLDLVTKLYPNLSVKHLETINTWSDEYNRNFNMDRKIKTNRDTDEYKKRVLPKTCIPRLEELYRFFDTDNKGFVVLDDLTKILGNACTPKEINMLFETSDVDKDGKLTLKEFVHVLLPPDLEIEGLV